MSDPTKENPSSLPKTPDELHAALQQGKLSEQQLAEMHKQATLAWMVLIIRGIRGTSENPSGAMMHAHGTRLYVRTTWKKQLVIAKDGTEEEVFDLVLHNVPHFNFHPASGIEVVTDGFGPEWPPKERILEDSKRDHDLRQRIQVASPEDLKRITTVPRKKGRVRQ